MNANNSSMERRRRLLLSVCAGLFTLPVGTATLEAYQDTPAGPPPVVVLETNFGNIAIELLPDKSPKTVANFLELVRSGFYEEMLFHRVVRDFAIQTGALGMDGTARSHEVTPLENEAGNRVQNVRGAVAMARGEDPHSADTQFFINVRNNPDLDFTSFTRQSWGYAVFGYVVEGMDVVEEIALIPTKRLGPYREFPETPVALYSAYVR